MLLSGNAFEVGQGSVRYLVELIQKNGAWYGATLHHVVFKLKDFLEKERREDNSSVIDPLYFLLYSVGTYAVVSAILYGVEGDAVVRLGLMALLPILTISSG